MHTSPVLTFCTVLLWTGYGWSSVHAAAAWGTWPAGRPAVQSLQIKEVHTYKHSNVPVHNPFILQAALLYFYDSKHKRGDSATFLLSFHVDVHELRGSHKAAPIFHASRITPREKKVTHNRVPMPISMIHCRFTTYVWKKFFCPAVFVLRAVADRSWGAMEPPFLSSSLVERYHCEKL